MKKSIVFLLFAVVSVRAVAQRNESSYLIHRVNIVNVLDGTISANRSVWVSDGQIRAIDSYEKLSTLVPKNQHRDGKNSFMIPGLWDMHIHLEGADLVDDNEALLPVFLAYGITTVRDCASDLGEQVIKWRNQINEGKLIGPRIYTAGLKLEGKNSVWKGDLEIENEAELNQMLNRLDTYPVDFVKITENTLKGDLFLKSVQAAHQRGYRVSGHVPIDVTIDQLVQAGFTSIEHATYLLRLGSDETAITQNLLAGTITRSEAEARYVSEYDATRALAGYQRLAKAGVFVCPTLIGGRELAYLQETDHTNDLPLQYLTKRYVANYQWRIGRMANEAPAQKQQRKDRYQFLLQQLPQIQTSGIRIIAGSDAAALNTYVYPAESLIQELEIFQKAGLQPLAILQSATINGAHYFGVEAQTATIEADKHADFVLLEKNPLQDISAVRSILAVSAQGVFYDRKALDRLIDSARQRKTEIDQR